MLYNESNELGLIPIRTPEKSYVPLKGKYLIGYWTHTEIKKALEEGYKLIDIEWSILWEEGKEILMVTQKEEADLQKILDQYITNIVNRTLNG